MNCFKDMQRIIDFIIVMNMVLFFVYYDCHYYNYMYYMILDLQWKGMLKHRDSFGKEKLK